MTNSNLFVIMNRRTIAKGKVMSIRTTTEFKKRFEELADGWGITYGAAFERLVIQAEHRNVKRFNGAKAEVQKV